MFAIQSLCLSLLITFHHLPTKCDRCHLFVALVSSKSVTWLACQSCHFLSSHNLFPFLFSLAALLFHFGSHATVCHAQTIVFSSSCFSSLNFRFCFLSFLHEISIVSPLLLCLFVSNSNLYSFYFFLIQNPQHYLQKYGYMNESIGAANLIVESSFRDAVRTFQRFAGLNVTGISIFPV